MRRFTRSSPQKTSASLSPRNFTHVLREIQASVGKPANRFHRSVINADFVAAPFRHDIAKVPYRHPKFVEVLDRPFVQGIVAVERSAPALLGGEAELRPFRSIRCERGLEPMMRSKDSGRLGAALKRASAEGQSGRK